LTCPQASRLRAAADPLVLDLGFGLLLDGTCDEIDRLAAWAVVAPATPPA
jgi:hypothetical protein